MVREVILVGGFHEVIELCEEVGIVIKGIFDNNLKEYYLGYAVLGTDSDASELYKQYSDVPLVLTPDSPLAREKLFKIYSDVGFEFESVISPSAKISKSAVIGKGCIIQHNANISSSTIIGDFVKLNTNANVMHDCELRDFVTVAPNAVILGRIVISKRSYVGANATILPGLMVGEGAIIGAGSVLTKNVPSGKTVKGVPAH